MDRIKLSLDSVQVESFSTHSVRAASDDAFISQCTSCPTQIDARCTCQVGRDGMICA